DANNLHPPYVLQSGQHLVVPRVRSYQVQPGDTLYAVSRRYAVGLNEIVQANALSPPYSLRVGQVLVLPPGAGSAPRVAPPAPATAVATSPLPPARTAAPVES